MQLKQYDEAILALNSVIQLAPSKTNYQELKRIAIKNKSNTFYHILAWQSICQTTSFGVFRIFSSSFFFSHLFCVLNEKKQK
jgi:hypothetical protein